MFQVACGLVEKRLSRPVSTIVSLSGFPAPRAAKYLKPKVFNFRPQYIVLQFGAHEGHAEPVEIVFGAPRFLRNRCTMSRSLTLTRQNQNRRPWVAILRWCPVVVVGKGFRASTVWASKRGKIGHPTLALKTDEHEW